MKIKNVHLNNFRNNEHVQFQTRFKGLIERLSAMMLKIEALFNIYLLLYTQEIEAFDVIRKSDFVQLSEDADNLRDNTFRGMCNALESAHRHFRSEIRQAAVRLQVVFDYYGDLAKETREGETADMNKFIADLKGKYAADVAIVGLSEWVIELKINNDAFDQLKQNKTTEASVRTQLKMKQERAKVDTAYSNITAQINALILVEGEANYAVVTNELNALIDEYNLIIAKRKASGEKASPEEVVK
jgi:hypothetical protein